MKSNVFGDFHRDKDVMLLCVPYDEEDTYRCSNTWVIPLFIGALVCGYFLHMAISCMGAPINHGYSLLQAHLRVYWRK